MRLPWSVLGLAMLTACGSGGAGSGAAGPPASGPAPAAAPKVQAEEVTYQAGGVTLKGYLAWDAARGGKRPGVLVVHEWWGHNDYARGRARQLAELGYVALALDMFGDGKTAAHPKEAGEFAQAAMADLAVARARFEAARDRLAAHPSTDGARIAAIGYCFGGAVVLHMARLGVDLRGVASFHGSLGTEHPAQAGAVKAAVLVCHGAADEFIPAAVVEAFKQEMTAAGVELDFVSYDGALHGFTNPAADELATKFGLKLNYDAKADADSWARLTKFLAGVFE